MRAGELKHRITIKRPVKTKNKFGETVSDYLDIYSIRAEVKYSEGTRQTEDGIIFTNYIITFNIRQFYNDIIESDIVEYNNKRYRILSIVPFEKSQFISLKTELINE